MRRLLTAAALLLASTTTAAAEVPGLVDVAWVKQTGLEHLVPVDLQDPKQFQRFHIPGSVNLPYSVWRTSPPKGNKDRSLLQSMLPTTERLASMLGAAGIDNDDHVLIVATGRGAGDLAAAARVYWTFKVLGHDAVSVLDGGLVAYADAGGRLTAAATQRPATTFTANPRPELVPDAAAVQAALARGAQGVDARSEGEFVGIYTGDSDERPGTIPGSLSLPHDWLGADGSGRLRSAGALKQLFEARGIDADGEQVHFCHSGNRAALTWFAAYAVMGNDKATLYDGSMMEWAQTDDLPVAAEIELCDAC
jgi:thiosulfate/3-mercaptopyruvate sulfurtransferase